MCGRFEGANETWAQLRELLGDFAHLPPETAARYADREIRPTNTYPILTKTDAKAKAGENPYQVREARWWLIPGFFKGAVKEWKATTFNAKIEEAFEKPSFRSPWKSKHCLVPVDSFWEWKLLNPEAPKSKQVKDRYCIRRGDNHPMVLAGLWDRATTAEGEVVSFTVLTRGNGPDMEGLHTREPIMLHPEEWRPWLDCEPMPELLTPTAAGLLRTAIETRVYA